MACGMHIQRNGEVRCFSREMIYIYIYIHIYNSWPTAASSAEIVAADGNVQIFCPLIFQWSLTRSITYFFMEQSVYIIMSDIITAQFRRVLSQCTRELGL